METAVLIVGGGPVGLSLAIELGLRGVACTVLERNPGTNAHPRANVVASRTMEHFRRWGIADRVAAAGLPSDHPVEVVFTTRLCASEIFRFSFPSYAQCTQPTQALREAVPDLNHSPYFKTSVGQNQLEPVLLDVAASLPSVTLMHGWQLDGFEQGDAPENGVRATVSRPDGGRGSVIAAQYLVGCDGGRSRVRAQMKAELLGSPDLGRFVGIFFRAPAFDSVHALGRGSLYWTLNRDAPGVFIAIDGSGHFTFQRNLQPGEEAEAIDPGRTLDAAMGRAFEHDILSVQPWRAHAVVADRYRDRRVFIAGDAAHLFVPTGGFGMNTGIGDAVDLGWKLAAVLGGWAPDRLLDSYGLERRPIGVRNTSEAADNYRKMLPAFDAAIQNERDGKLPAPLCQALADGFEAGRKHFSASGIHLGVRYEHSPLCIPDGSIGPADDPRLYVPTTRAGHRAPHAWIEPGRSTLDLFGPGFVLLQTAEPVHGEQFATAAQAMGIPFRAVHLPQPAVRAAYGDGCVLVRPDGHVAWRATSPPADPAAVLAVATGRTL